MIAMLAFTLILLVKLGAAFGGIAILAVWAWRHPATHDEIDALPPLTNGRRPR